MGGMYVANDFQRLMMRKEVENWRGRREKDEVKESEEEQKKKKRGKKNLELRQHEVVLICSDCSRGY